MLMHTHLLCSTHIVFPHRRYMEGGSLRDVIDDIGSVSADLGTGTGTGTGVPTGGLPEETAAHFVAQILEGLIYLHEQGACEGWVRWRTYNLP